MEDKKYSDEKCKHGIFPKECCCHCNGKVKKSNFSGITENDLVKQMKDLRKGKKIDKTSESEE